MNIFYSKDAKRRHYLIILTTTTILCNMHDARKDDGVAVDETQFPDVDFVSLINGIDPDDLRLNSGTSKTDEETRAALTRVIEKIHNAHQVIRSGKWNNDVLTIREGADRLHAE